MTDGLRGATSHQRSVVPATARDEGVCGIHANIGRAQVEGVFGVLILRVSDEPPWGCGAVPKIEECLAYPERFDNAECRRFARLPMAVERQR